MCASLHSLAILRINKSSFFTFQTTQPCFCHCMCSSIVGVLGIGSFDLSSLKAMHENMYIVMEGMPVSWPRQMHVFGGKELHLTLSKHAAGCLFWFWFWIYRLRQKHVKYVNGRWCGSSEIQLTYESLNLDNPGPPGIHPRSTSCTFRWFLLIVILMATHIYMQACMNLWSWFKHNARNVIFVTYGSIWLILWMVLHTSSPISNKCTRQYFLRKYFHTTIGTYLMSRQAWIFCAIFGLWWRMLVADSGCA